MEPLIIALVVLCLAFSMALLGMYLNHALPERHLDSEARDVVKLVMGLVATMAALVLGLLVASANSSHDDQTRELRQLSADVMLLDRTLALYGPEAEAVRASLRDLVRQTHDSVWSSDGARPENLNSTSIQQAAKARLAQVARLDPKTDTQRLLKGRAIEQVDGVSRLRLQMFESRGGQISWPFLTVLIFWIAILFLGFGLLAPFNPTVAVTQFLGAVSVAGALFLILELNEPYRGLLQISDAPLAMAIGQLDR
jgi:hypothetical protein